MTQCPHCGRAVLADRIGPGLAVGYASGSARDRSDGSFVLGARCPYPHCARPVFARALGPGAPSADLSLTTLPDVVGWSPSLLARAAREWLVPCGLILGFASIPAYGFCEASASLRCGGIAWLFFAAGSLLALVPIIYFVRGLGSAARDALVGARLSRASVSAGGCGGLRVAPDPTTYRSH
jgi:hypothetical protein